MPFAVVCMPPCSVILDRTVKTSLRRAGPPGTLTPMSAPRVDPLTGEVVQVVASRQARPNLPIADCPFCPGGIEAPDPYQVRAFPNRWPALPDGACEVVLYSPDHDASFATLGPDQARGRGRPLGRALGRARARATDVDYVLVFENRGAEVGATISHPHGQIYAFDLVPAARRARARDGDADAGLGPAGARRSSGDDGRVVAGVGARPRRPGPTRSCSHRTTRSPDLPSLPPESRDDLAALLVDVVGRLDRLFDAPMPYMLWFHQRPFDGGDWPTAWVHAHIAPLLRSPGTLRFVAAGELGGGMMFNPVDPIDAARALRDA